MLNRRDFFKRLFSGGVFLSSTSWNPFLKILNSPLALGETKGDLSAPKIRVIGLGGCGNQAIDHMVLSTPNRDNFILADRDFESENSTSIRQLIILETDLSEMGARTIDDPVIAFKKDQQKILQALQGSDMVFIIAGLGGRTGTFWAPVIAEICNKLDILTVAVITIPLINGPSQHRRWAEKGMEQLSTLADTVIPVFLDEYDSALFQKNDIKAIYALSHEKILEAVAGIPYLLCFPGCTGESLRDMKSLFHKKGLGTFQIGAASGSDRVRKAVQMVFSGLSERGIRSAAFKQVHLGFSIGPNLNSEEIIEAKGLIRPEIDYPKRIILGDCLHQTNGEELRILFFASWGKYEKPGWFKTIFSQVENKNLNLELERLASEMSWTLREGEAFTPDLVVAPYFIAIVDRNLIGEECWNIFLEFCRETTDDTPLIIVDNLRHLKLPDHKNILYADLNNPQAFEEIKSTIRKIGS